MSTATGPANRPLRFGLLGYGHWGPNLAGTLGAVDGCAVTTICDLSEGNLARARAKNPDVRTTRAYAELLGDPELDGILVSTPTATHYGFAKAALDAGKHVLVEKPMTLKAGEGRELTDLARSRGLVLMAGYVFLYNPAVLKIKEYLDSNYLGTTYYVTTNRTNLGPVRTDVSALWDLASHDVSILNFWFGAQPTAVYAAGQTFLASTVSDCGFLHLEYPGNRFGHVTVSWLSPVKDRQVTVVGSRRMLTWNDVNVNEPIRIYDKGVMETVAHRGGETFMDFKVTMFDGDVLIPKVPLLSP
ncbi:MAG: Gfo/Idh/MocA family oxidoreductase, partial [Candidatus Methylomirabilis sp.]|nr:Gfo/Idh/MocA family oxidoreductase [Deltaproteobacteria bacterium]